jgi:hypothetical protein
MHTTKEESDVRQETRTLIKEMLDEGTFSGTPPSDLEENPPLFRFFLDYDEEHDALNVLAVATNQEMNRGDGPGHELFRDPTAKKVRGRTELSGFGATFPHENSGVSWTGMADEVRGPEIQRDLAEKIHPRLFERID